MKQMHFQMEIFSLVEMKLFGAVLRLMNKNDKKSSFAVSQMAAHCVL